MLATETALDSYGGAERGNRDCRPPVPALEIAARAPTARAAAPGFHFLHVCFLACVLQVVQLRQYRAHGLVVAEQRLDHPVPKGLAANFEGGAPLTDGPRQFGTAE